MTVTLILASASPARLETLRRAGVQPQVMVSGVDESVVAEPDPARLALRLAELKGRTVAARVQRDPAGARMVLVACDSVFELDQVAYGKPGSADLARERWRRMSGRAGVLHTGHVVIDLTSGRETTAVASTVVEFGQMSHADIEAYVATGEPLQVAGGFTVDGLGGAFVERVEGDPHNVVGISLPLLRRLLAELGVAWTDLWPPVDPSPSSP